MNDENNNKPDPETTGKKKLGLPEKIMIGLGLGIAAGLFLGEIAAPLKILADAFIGLLQMTVMPFIILALIGGIGKLSGRQARLLVTRVSLIIVGLWFVGFYSIILFGLSLPEQKTASFFTASLIAEPRSFDFFSLFIPSNPFYSLAQNKVPAVVLFCLFCGAAVIGMQNKDRIIGAIDTLMDILGRVTDFVVRLSPYGVFCIAASAAGTMNLDELSRIQGYLVMLTVICLAICFVLVPLLISAFTPFRSKDISPLLRAAFVLAFATGKTLVVLPLLIQGIHEIFKKHGMDGKEEQSTIDVLVPLAYSFPHLGRIMATAFIPFAAWYIGSALSADQYPLLIGASTFVHFSNSPVSIPFLLDLMQLPNDLFQLFVVTGVYVGRLTDAVGAAYILAVTVLGACVVSGRFVPRWRSVGTLAIGTLIFSIFIAIGGRWYLSLTLDESRSKESVVASMQVLRAPAPYSEVEAGPNPVALAPGQSRLDRILSRGSVRVGFGENELPFVYRNAAGQLAGFDIELVNLLADDLDVAIEYVPIGRSADVVSAFRNDHIDIAIGGYVDTVQRSRDLDFSEPYLYVTLALVVPDYRDKEFSNLHSIDSLGTFSLGVMADGMFDERVQQFFPNADVVMLDSPREFFDNDERPDALLISAEAGSAWSILNPGFQVVTPLPRPVRLPLVVPYSTTADPIMDEFIDNWIMLRLNDGSFDDMFDYWILGKGTEVVEPRWSVIRDVLHWVD